MAGDYVPMQVDLLRKREVLRIAKATGMSRHEVVGWLLEFWAWAQVETMDGAIDDLPVEFVQEILGGPDEFWQAIQDVGWLEVTADGGLVLPHADRWITKGAKARLDKAERKRKSLAKKETAEAIWSAEGAPRGAPRGAPDLPLKEKERREEERKEENSSFKKSPPPPPREENEKLQPEEGGGPDLEIQAAVNSFLWEWNKTKGTTPCPDQFAMGRPDLLLERFGNPAWVANWPKALAKFPLPFLDADCPMTVTQFLKEETVAKILAGDFDKPKRQGGYGRKRVPKTPQLEVTDGSDEL